MSNCTQAHRMIPDKGIVVSEDEQPRDAGATPDESEPADTMLQELPDGPMPDARQPGAEPEAATKPETATEPDPAVAPDQSLPKIALPPAPVWPDNKSQPDKPAPAKPAPAKPNDEAPKTDNAPRIDNAEPTDVVRQAGTTPGQAVPAQYLGESTPVSPAGKVSRTETPLLRVLPPREPAATPVPANSTYDRVPTLPADPPTPREIAPLVRQLAWPAAHVTPDADKEADDRTAPDGADQLFEAVDQTTRQPASRPADAAAEPAKSRPARTSPRTSPPPVVKPAASAKRPTLDRPALKAPAALFSSPERHRQATYSGTMAEQDPSLVDRVLRTFDPPGEKQPRAARGLFQVIEDSLER